MGMLISGGSSASSAVPVWSNGGEWGSKFETWGTNKNCSYQLLGDVHATRIASWRNSINGRWQSSSLVIWLVGWLGPQPMGARVVPGPQWVVQLGRKAENGFQDQDLWLLCGRRGPARPGWNNFRSPTFSHSAIDWGIMYIATGQGYMLPKPLD